MEIGIHYTWLLAFMLVTWSLADGNQIVMEPTLEYALNRLFGGGAPSPSVAPAAGAAPSAEQPATAEIGQLVGQAQTQYQRAQDALRTDDFAGSGEAIRALGDTLNQLQQTFVAMSFRRGTGIALRQSSDEMVGRFLRTLARVSYGYAFHLVVALGEKLDAPASVWPERHTASESPYAA